MIKQKLIGILIITIGALPFLLMIDSISAFFTQYSFLSFIMPGEIGYQVIIILLGVWLMFRIKSRVEMERHRI